MRVLIIYSTDGRGHQSRCEAMQEQFEDLGHEVDILTAPFITAAEFKHDLTIFDLKDEEINYKQGITLEITDGPQKIKRTDYHINMLDAPLCLRKKYCKDKIKIGVFIECQDLERYLPDDDRVKVIKANKRNWDKTMRESDIRITSGGQTFLEAMQFDPLGGYLFPIIRNPEEEMNVKRFGIHRRMFELKILLKLIKQGTSFKNAFVSYLLEEIKK